MDIGVYAPESTALLATPVWGGTLRLGAFLDGRFRQMEYIERPRSDLSSQLLQTLQDSFTHVLMTRMAKFVTIPTYTHI